jgi:Ca-activated chloride channel family protein
MTFGASLRLDHELLAVEQEHRVHCMLDLTAPPAPGSADRPPLHLAVVIDRSGSMHGPKLETAKRCASFLVRKLRHDDVISIVVYDDQVHLVHGLAPVGSDRATIEHAIMAIVSGGSTNLSGGWLKGAEQLRGVPGGTGPKKVLLLSDGQANQGITDAAELAAMAKVAADDGIGTTTIGFGDGFDEDLMTAMADAGGGNAYFAAGVDEAAGIFAQEFEDLVRVIAQNMSIEIRPTADVDVVEVLNDYPHVGVVGGVQIQLGDAYGDERRRVVFSLHVPRLEMLGPVSLAELVVRYVSVGEEIAAHELHVPVLVNLVSADEAAAAGPDAEVIEEIVVLKSARAQEQARSLAERGRYDEAGSLLQERAKDLRTLAPASGRAEELLAQADEMESFGRSMQQGVFDAMQSKQMRYSAWQKQRGRPRRPHPDEDTP